jgi:hypothetical protein
MNAAQHENLEQHELAAWMDRKDEPKSIPIALGAEYIARQ